VPLFICLIEAGSRFGGSGGFEEGSDGGGKGGAAPANLSVTCQQVFREHR